MEDGGSDGFGEKRERISRIQWREDGSDDGKGILRDAELDLDEGRGWM